MKTLVTGATGMVGSHIAEKLVLDGQEVVALAQETSDTGFLRDLGVQIRYASITDRSAVFETLRGIDRVCHAAAVTEEWSSWEKCSNVNIRGTRNILEASTENAVERFFFVSSLAVMGFRNHYNTGVETDYEKTGDPYIDTKMDAEKLVWSFAAFGLPVTVLRPGFMYGPRDRRFLPRILDKLRRERFMFIGDGKNKMNLNYAGNFADAVVLAGKTPDSVGQAYNIANDDKSLDVETFIDKVADLWDLPRPEKHISVRSAKVATWLMETGARAVRKKTPPLLTKTRMKLLSLNLEFDISKARQQLGFENKVGIDEGLERTKQWMQDHQRRYPAEPVSRRKRLPYTYRENLTVDSPVYGQWLRDDMKIIRRRDPDDETIIRFRSILGETHTYSDTFAVDRFTAYDDQLIRVNKWRMKNPEHILIYVNGLESHGGWFSEVATALRTRGTLVYGLDRRGSGLNSRVPGKYENWLDDLKQVIESARNDHPQASVHVASVCFGAKVAIACAIQHPDLVDSLILISPVLHTQVDITSSEKFLVGLSLLPGLSFNIASPVRKDQMFTDSPAGLYFLYKDKLRTVAPTADDFHQMRRIGSFVSKNLDRLTTPSIVCLGGKDAVLDIDKTCKTLTHCASQPRIVQYADSEHILFFGDAKDRLISDINDYVKETSPRRAAISEPAPVM